MGRHVVKRGTSTEPQKAEVASADKAPILGGASGIPTDPNPQSTMIHGLGGIAPAREEVQRVDKIARKYRVTNPQGIRVIYGGQAMTLQPGKEFSDACTDIELLKKQGVKFEELVPPPIEDFTMHADPLPQVDPLNPASA